MHLPEPILHRLVFFGVRFESNFIGMIPKAAADESSMTIEEYIKEIEK